MADDRRLACEPKEPIATPEDLAERLARLARRLRETAPEVTDAYAQTIAYGLFAARCFHEGPDPFTRRHALEALPEIDPRLRQLCETIAAPAVDAIVDVLASADLKPDRVVHFYETFLAAYDPALKARCGVYFTPAPVVRYLVRSVDHLLRVCFGLEGGLADRSKVRVGDTEVHVVQVLDPAVGTGAFLHGVVDLVKERLVDAGEGPTWDAYLGEDLLPRLFGFESLMAPYAVAHMTMARALGPRATARLGITLTNTLEEAAERPILVVLGNPPYAGHSANRSSAGLREYAHAYKKDAHGNVYPELARRGQAKWLSDDYVKFIRFAESRIERTGHGIVAFITNHAWIDNPTFFGMRRKLHETFDDVWILDLHGAGKKEEQVPGGGRGHGKDENVFDIQQGVAISIFARYPDRGTARDKTVRHADLWGTRAQKYEYLASHDVGSTTWTRARPAPPRWSGGPGWVFVPSKNDGLAAELEDYWGLPAVFGPNGAPAPGIVTTHDRFAVSWDADEMVEKVERFLRTTSEEEARSLWTLCSQEQWNYAHARTRLGSSGWREQIIPLKYRPFDSRVTVYDAAVAVHLRHDKLHRHMLRRNVGLQTVRRIEAGAGWDHALAVTGATSHHSLSIKEINYVFPLWIHDGDARRPNLHADFVAKLPGRPSPEEVFAFIYAILHASSYRTRYAELLRRDWARVPTPSDEGLFRKLAALGRTLVDLHTWKVAPVRDTLPTYPVAGGGKVERVKWQDDQVWINGAQRFDGVPRIAWDLRIGSYEPARKWLEDRRHPAYAALTVEDVAHYRRIVGVLVETASAARAIDAAIAEHGSWPIR